MNPREHSKAPAKLRFSQELQQLLEQFGERPVRVEELLLATKGRGMHLLLILITLPFLTPLPLPGFSIPFGFVVALIGARMAFAQKPWLPQRLLQRELPPGFLARLLRSTSTIVRVLEFLLRPRLLFMDEQVVYRRIAGALIALCGVLLLAPVPVPFSNALPAWTVLLLAAGALQRDGLFFVFGCLAFIVTGAFFTALVFGGAQAVEAIRELLVAWWY